MIYINSYGSILFFTAQIFQSVRLVSAFSSDKNREFSGSVCRLVSDPSERSMHLFRRRRLRYIRIHIAFAYFLLPAGTEKPAIRPLRTTGIALLIFLIVLRENALDLLLGLHDLVVKALCRHAHRAVPENDQLL